MCGFVCLWKIGDKDLARRMVDRIAHRGPDAVDVVAIDRVPAVMAHCRLSIIGTQNGAQPIYQGRDILVANGEIYNHADLRAILGESAFETDSDSEAILHLFRAGEARWISKLDGMFAFVLATPSRIIAARDPLGIKPLYMARIGDGLAFASELKAFDGFGIDDIEAVPPGSLFDSRDGRPLANSTNARLTAISLDAAPRRQTLAVAGGVRKAVAIGAALRGGLISGLVTDEGAARAILDEA